MYLGVSGAIKWSALSGLASAWRITLFALILLWTEVVVAAWRLCVLFRPRGFQLSLNSSIRLSLVGMFFNLFLPGSGGGDVVKVFYATHGNRGRGPEVIAILLLDRAAGLFALLVWLLLAWPLFPQLVRSMPILGQMLWIAALTVVAMLAAVSVCFSTRLRNSRLLSWLERQPLGRHLTQVFDTIHSYRSNIASLWTAVGISLFAHTLTILAMLLVARAVVSATVTWKAAILIPLGMVVNALPLTPGGLGVGEAAFDALFKGAGLTGGAETLLAWRLLMLLISLLGLIFYLQGRRQFVYASGATSAVDGQS